MLDFTISSKSSTTYSHFLSLQNAPNHYSPCFKNYLCVKYVGGAVAAWLMRSSPDRAVRVRALVVLCTWVTNFTHEVPVSIQVYKWVPANLMLGVTLR